MLAKEGCEEYEDCQIMFIDLMIVRIKKPEYIGVYKLNKQAQRVAVKNMINKKLKLMKSLGEVVSAIIITDQNGEEYLINLNL